MRKDYPPSEELKTAIRTKKIWSGDRKDVSWSSGFDSSFWTQWKHSRLGWRCETEDSGRCTHPDYRDNHHDLEIGHIEGFYRRILSGTSADLVTVCDGENHWDVYLYDTVVSANEDVSNLQPQCVMCNRSRKQRRRDLSRGEADCTPKYASVCLGGCRFTKISLL
jgi:hypothetical protein